MKSYHRVENDTHVRGRSFIGSRDTAIAIVRISFSWRAILITTHIVYTRVLYYTIGYVVGDIFSP